MPSLIQILASSLAAIVFVMVLLWLVGCANRNVSIVDQFWGAGFALVAWLTLCLTSANTPRSYILVALVTIWALRLSIYLTWRNWGKGEDHRYAQMRERHGNQFWWISLFTVFLLQAAILWFVSFPIQAALASDVDIPLSWLDVAAVLAWITGMTFESVGDFQLARFKMDPANERKVMDQGLWRYTRHPNYFGDFCVWWSIYLFALAGGAGWTIASPLLMSWLLMKVSGVTLLESTIRERRPDYVDYIRRTNAFFPGPPEAAIKTHNKQIL